MNKQIFLMLFFVTATTLAKTNEIVNDYRLQMKREVAELESQWDILCADTEVFASTILSNENAYILFNELMNRINDTKDPFNNLEKYVSIFSLGGEEPLTIYNAAYKMYYRKNDLRAGDLFYFLISDKNPNKFTIGNSYYWLGKICQNEYKDNETAFKYYMMVHKYPACLVYTANAYVFAADILNKMGQADNALALLAVDVPVFTFRQKLIQRHIKSYSICKNRNDITNAVRHLQTVYLINTNIISTIKILLNTFPEWCEKYFRDSLTNLWCENDVLYTINKGISNPYETPDDNLFFDAVTHKWPAVYDVSKIILTNRTLSNNIFPQERSAFDVKKRRKPQNTEKKL
jgi:hypothetical protein